MIFLVLLLLHFLAIILVAVLWKSRKLVTRQLFFPMLVLIPFWGCISFLVLEIMERKGKTGIRDIELEKLKINDIKYKRIEIDRDENQDITVPLEEALLVNDKVTRRKLMLDILQREPSEYIELLQSARMSEDTEISHYATTSMMEIQSMYEEELHILSQKYNDNPDEIKIALRYRKVLKRYIESGLVSGNILKIYQLKLDEILGELIRNDKDNKKYIMEQLDNMIDCGKLDEFEKKAFDAKSRWGEEEKIYMILVKYYRNISDGEKLKNVVREVKEKNIYLSHQGREWFEFWLQGEF